MSFCWFKIRQKEALRLAESNFRHTQHCCASVGCTIGTLESSIRKRQPKPAHDAKAGGPEVLQFIENQVPDPGAHEVRIKVKAIGINRAESMWRNDKYVEPVKYPAGLGYEAVGTVDAVGKDVTGIAVGDDVNVIPAFSQNHTSPMAK